MKIKVLFSILCLSAVLISCYRSPNDEIFASDLDMVVTNYEPDFNYSQYTTFTVADSFGLATNVDDVSPDDANDPKIVVPVKESIINNMLNYGYVYIPLDSADSNNVPDIYIPVTISYVNTKGVTYYPIYSPGYGWGYGGGYYGGGFYGGYYGYWNFIPTTFSFDQGSLFIDWIDIKNAQLVNDSIIISDKKWNMAISGLIEENTGQERTDKLKTAIDLGFEQSPYLNKNQ